MTNTATTTAQAGFEIRNIAGLIGAEVLADKDVLLSGVHSAAIREALEQRGVLAFPSIDFSDQEQMAFTKTLGTSAKEVTGEEVYKVSMDVTKNPTANYLKGAFYWHIDGTMSQVPILASMLSAKILSKTGGDTEFANTYAAYEDLPDAEKAKLDGLRVIHTLTSAQLYVQPEPAAEEFDAWKSLGSNELPLVWKHASGRKSLVIGATADYIVGMDPGESKALLVRLREWATRPEFVYTHKWTVGDTVIWDNTGTMHRATPYPLESGRMMHRTKLQGEEACA
jgi:alpha-ketoglutarate-dependent taurine dioxygenase